MGVTLFWFDWSPQATAADRLSVELPAWNTKPQLISTGFFSPPQFSVSFSHWSNSFPLTVLAQRSDPAAVNLYNTEKLSNVKTVTVSNIRISLTFEVFLYLTLNIFMKVVSNSLEWFIFVEQIKKYLSFSLLAETKSQHTEDWQLFSATVP